MVSFSNGWKRIWHSSREFMFVSLSGRVRRFTLRTSLKLAAPCQSSGMLTFAVWFAFNLNEFPVVTEVRSLVLFGSCHLIKK